MRPQTRGEELANSLTHGTALLASVAALPLLIVVALGRRDPFQLVGSAIFGTTLVLLYLASTLYHAVPASRAKQVLRVLDHSAIYLLIAGTYTPFTLGPLRGPWGWSLLGVVWTLAAFGIVSKLTIGFRYPRLSTALYVGMGWLGVVAIGPMLTHLSTAGLAWLAAGGLAYTGGVAFYVLDSRFRFAHTAWHVCVVAGSTCHVLAVLWSSAPAMG